MIIKEQIKDYSDRSKKFLTAAVEDMHSFGRSTFASNYARGGMAATLFAPRRRDMLLSPWRIKAAEGSQRHINNLQKLRAAGSVGAGEALEKLEQGKKTGKMAGRLFGGALFTGFALMPAIMVDGPGIQAKERARAFTSGLGSMAGWEVGSRVGLGIGAAVGSFIPIAGQVVGGIAGYFAGGFIGSLAGEGLTDALTRIPDKAVANERSKRYSSWGSNRAAFGTQRAATMRQQSLALMNRGMLSSRSLMGQEAVYVHR